MSCLRRPGGAHEGPTSLEGHCGFRNFNNYRLRLLLTVGLDWNTVHWQAPPATPIRGRSPRLVA